MGQRFIYTKNVSTTLYYCHVIRASMYCSLTFAYRSYEYDFDLGSFKQSQMTKLTLLKGCGMGPWLVLISPCFGENVVATCKIWSFLCSLDNLLQKT